MKGTLLPKLCSSPECFNPFSSVTVQQSISCFGVCLSIRHSGRALGTEAALVRVSGRWAES